MLSDEILDVLHRTEEQGRRMRKRNAKKAKARHEAADAADAAEQERDAKAIALLEATRTNRNACSCW